MSFAFGWAAAALLMGCHGSSSTSAAAGPSVQIFRVTTAQIVERPVPSVIPLTGSLTAEVRTDLTANATGKVARTFVERGQKVQQGTVLPLLDVRSGAASAAEAQEESASARLEADLAECARQDALAGGGAGSPQLHDTLALRYPQRLGSRP